MLAIDLSPTQWEEIKFQPGVVNLLQTAVKEKKIPRNTLLVGATGRGKTTTAKILAASIVCENIKPDGNPCKVCGNCQDIFSDRWSRNVKYVNGITDNGIDYYRDLLSSLLNFGGFYSEFKVCIIDEVHGLSKEALQTFLLPTESQKHSNIYFIFSTTEGEKVKQTLASRCLDIKLKTPDELELSKFLVEKVQNMKLRLPKEFTIQSIFEIASASNGSVRSALRTLEKVLMSKNYSIENVQTLLGSESDSNVNVVKMVVDLIDEKYTVALNALDKLIQESDATTVFNQIFRQVLDIYMIKAKGVGFGKPYYEKFLGSNFKNSSVESLKKFLDTLTCIKEKSVYGVDRNYFITKLIC